MAEAVVIAVSGHGNTLFLEAAKVAAGETPPVVAADHSALLASDDPVLAANKRLCYDMYRTILQAGRADEIRNFVGSSYVQHNPNAASGPEALAEFVRNSRPERPILDRIELPLVAIVAERDLVQFAFVRRETDADGAPYYTSWFDLFRIENGLIVEHWDPALKDPQILQLDPNSQRLPAN